jgi:hypothetical protein
VWAIVTAARRILTLEIKETAYRYEEELQMNLISSSGQTTGGGILVIYLGGWARRKLHNHKSLHILRIELKSFRQKRLMGNDVKKEKSFRITTW